MITPQQRNAWRGAYLRQLRKIAQTPFIPDLDLDEDEEFSWDLFDESDFEDHYASFCLKVMTPLWSAFVYVLRNHPYAFASMDAKCVRPEDRLSQDGLFRYLASISRYGQDTFLSNYAEVVPFKEELLNALHDNNEKDFFNTLAKNGIDISDMCLKVGYASRCMQAYDLAYDALENDRLDEAESIAKQEEEFYNERGLDTEYYDTHLRASGDDVQKILPLSKLPYYELDEDGQQQYIMSIKHWMYYFSIVNAAFMDKEVEVIKDLIAIPEYQDIILDIERLAYQVYGFMAERVYHIDL